jgi:hypothetical protein
MSPILQTSLNPIDAAKKKVRDFVAKHEFFSNVEVLTDEKGDLDTSVASALQQLGLGLVFEIDTATVQFPALGSTAIKAKAVFTITENVLFNRDENNLEASGKRATDVVCELFSIFNPLQGEVPVVLETMVPLSNTGGIVRFQVNGYLNMSWQQKNK